MGSIIHPPRPIRYPPPKSVGGKPHTADIVARACIIEKFDTGDYCRIIDKLKWRESGDIEIRFTYYYRKYKGNDKDWIYGQGAGHMNPKTLARLIKKAKTKPNFGDFGSSLNKIKII